MKKRKKRKKSNISAEKHFYTIEEAAEFFGLSKSGIRHTITQGYLTLADPQKFFVLCPDGSYEPTPQTPHISKQLILGETLRNLIEYRKEMNEKGKYKGKKCSIKNTKTGQVKTFDSQRLAADFVGVSSSSVYQSKISGREFNGWKYHEV